MGPRRGTATPTKAYRGGLPVKKAYRGSVLTWAQNNVFPYTFPFNLAAGPATPALRPAQVGVSGPHDWENVTQATLTTYFTEMAALGIKHVRFSAIWEQIEPTRNTYNWAQIDRHVNTALAAGLEPLVILLWSPDWAGTFETSGTTYMADWGEFATALALRFAGVVKTYEIWNEPNIDTFWLNGNANTFIPFFKTAANAIHAAVPTAKVLTPGMAPADTTGTTTAPLEFLTAMYQQGAAQLADGIGLHPYSFPDLPNSGATWHQWTMLPQFKSLMASYGDANKPIWITEYGAPTGSDRAVTEAAQAEAIVQAISWAADDPQFGPCFVYTNRDIDLGTNNMESWFGIKTITGANKPAATAITAEINRRANS